MMRSSLVDRNGSAMASLTAVEAMSKTKEKEIAVGITRFVNDTDSGFSGILKQRYTDFLVNEITLDGEVVHLTDLKAPRMGPVEQIAIPTNEETIVAPFANVMDGEANATSNDVLAKAVPDTTDTQKQETANTTVLPSVTAEPLKDVSEVDASRKFSLSEADAALLDGYFDQHTRKQLVKFYEKIIAEPNAKPFTFGSLSTPPMTDRSLRSQMHQNIRRIFNAVFETSVDEDSTIKVKCSHRRNAQPHEQHSDNNRQTGHRQQQRNKLSWKELGGEYLHFSLYKENKDTMEIVGFLGSRSHAPIRDFAFAGTKDRRAVTVQRVSVYRKYATDFVKLNKDLRNALVGNYKYMPNKLELGDLTGNEFLITLRECNFGDEFSTNVDERVAVAKFIVGKSLKSMHKHGFINYFGLQRFGSFNVGTDLVGRKILQGDFEGAVKAIMHYEPEALAAVQQPGSDHSQSSMLPRDDIARAKAINIWESTGRPQQPLNLMPRKFSGEISIINHLSRSNTKSDFVGALLSINRNLRLMYVHAYQSLVWNVVASHRWALFGNRVVPGDLVLVDSKDAITNDDMEISKQKGEEVDETGEVIIRPAGDDYARSPDDIFQRARPLTEEEVRSGKYTIFDIVLPTPGFDVEYPQNAVGHYYKEFMASERGGNLDPADMRRSHKDFSLSGSYRKLLSSINKNASYEIRTYTDDVEQMVETDLEKIRKVDPKAINAQNHRIGHQNQSATQSHRIHDHDENNRNSRGTRGRRGNRGDRGGRGGRNNHIGRDFNNQNGRFDSRLRRPSQEVFEEDIVRLNTLKVEKDSEAKDIEEIEAARLEAKQAETYAQELRRQSQAAWANAPQEIAEKERAHAARVTIERNATDYDLASKVTSAQPIFREKYIETDGNAGIRTGLVENSYVRGVEIKNIEDVLVQGTKRAMEDVSTESNKIAKLANDENSKEEVGINETTVSIRGGGDDMGDTIDADVDMETVVVESSPKPVKLAVIIKFQLGTSQYATMALRELMKDVQSFSPEYNGGR